MPPPRRRPSRRRRTNVTAFPSRARRHRLIGALAADGKCVAGADDRLSRLGQSQDAEREIDVDRTEDDDHGHLDGARDVLTARSPDRHRPCERFQSKQLLLECLRDYAVEKVFRPGCRAGWY